MRLGVLTFIAGKRGAELVRVERLGRAVRGVFDKVGDFALVLESLAGVEERPRLDFCR